MSIDYDTDADGDWYDDEDDDPGCTWCGGEGWDECSDVLAGCGPGCRSTAGDASTWCPCQA